MTEVDALAMIVRSLERLEDRMDRMGDILVEMDRKITINTADLTKHVMRTDILQEDVKVFRAMMVDQKEEGEAESERLEQQIDELEVRVECVEERKQKEQWSAAWHQRIFKWAWRVMAVVIAIGAAVSAGSSKISIVWTALKAMVGM